MDIKANKSDYQMAQRREGLSIVMQYAVALLWYVVSFMAAESRRSHISFALMS